MDIEHLKELAGTAEGDLWKPRLDVQHLDRMQGRKGGWHWRDTAENPPSQWRGPFDSEEDAWLAALREYEVLRPYRIVAWWYVIRQAEECIEAESPEAALAELKRRAADEDFEVDNYECDNSDGPTTYEVQDPESYETLAEEPSEQERLLRAAPALLKVAEFFASYERIMDTMITPQDRQMVLDAIAEAKGAA